MPPVAQVGSAAGRRRRRWSATACRLVSGGVGGGLVGRRPVGELAAPGQGDGASGAWQRRRASRVGPRQPVTAACGHARPLRSWGVADGRPHDPDRLTAIRRGNPAVITVSGRGRRPDPQPGHAAVDGQRDAGDRRRPAGWPGTRWPPPPRPPTTSRPMGWRALSAARSASGSARRVEQPAHPRGVGRARVDAVDPDALARRGRRPSPGSASRPRPCWPSTAPAAAARRWRRSSRC